MKLLAKLLVITFAVTSFYGCTPVIVGGAATTGAAAHDRRTIGTFVDDQGIEVKARLRLNEDKELQEQAHINIVSVNGVVLLAGQTPTEQQRTRAQNIVAGIEKVRHVHNELTIAAPNTLMTRSSDSLITGKVKTRLLGISDIEGFDGTRVKVVTENGVVYLMGLLRRHEADAASDRARQVGGVQKVVKLFEYVD